MMTRAGAAEPKNYLPDCILGLTLVCDQGVMDVGEGLVRLLVRHYA